MGAEALSGTGGARPRRSGAGRAGTPRAGSDRTKSGKPRPGTGGQGRRALEGKGPTPPAAMRPGHPAQRRSAASSDASRPRRQGDGPAPESPRSYRPAGSTGGAGPARSYDSAGSAGPARSYESAGPARSYGSARSYDSAGSGRSARSYESAGSGRSAGSAGSSGPPGRASRGAGDAAEFVAGRNAVVESLRAGVPSAVLYVGARVQHDDRIAEAIKLAADRGVAVLETGAAELDRHTGGRL